MRSYEAFVYGNSADEPNKLAERCLEVIESTLKSVERVTTSRLKRFHGTAFSALMRPAPFSWAEFLEAVVVLSVWAFYGEPR